MISRWSPLCPQAAEVAKPAVAMQVNAMAFLIGFSRREKTRFLLCGNAGGADDCSPFDHFLAHEIGELLGTHRRESRAFRFDALAHLGRIHDLHDLGVEKLNDLAGPAGANKPIQLFASKPASTSETVGSSGRALVLAERMEASAFSLPALTCGSAVGMVANII